MKQSHFEEYLSRLSIESNHKNTSGWIQMAIDMTEDQRTDGIHDAHEEILDDIFAALFHIKDTFGDDIAKQIHSCVCMIPSELSGAARYLYDGGSIDKIPEMARGGKFEGGIVADTFYKQMLNHLLKHSPEIVGRAIESLSNNYIEDKNMAHTDSDRERQSVLEQIRAGLPPRENHSPRERKSAGIDLG